MELNEDCLVIIFRQLNTRDQIAVASVCRRFRDIQFGLWQRKFTHFSDDKLDNIQYKDFSVLLESICLTVETMKLHSLTFERFQVLKLYKYPKLTSFKFMGHLSKMKDENILEMVKMFPNLQSFSPAGQFTGMYIEKWRHLRHLRLSHCEKKKFDCLEKIFERSHLKSVKLDVYRKIHKWTSRRAFKNFCDLESITVNSYELDWLKNILQFKNLKELTVKDRYKEGPFHSLLLNLHVFKRNDIVELETSIAFPFCEPTPVAKFENLRKLVLCDQNIAKCNDTREAVPNLREIIFQRCEVWDANDILFWLIDSNQLDLISVEDCQCVFREFILNVDDIAQNRTHELRFNFNDNTLLELDDDFRIPFMSYESILLKIQGTSSLVKITSENSKYRWMTLRVCFQ